MKIRVVLLIAATVACCVSTAAMPAASAAPVSGPTLIRLEVSPFDAPSRLTVSVDNCVARIASRDLSGAMAACDAAVSAARDARMQSSVTLFASGAGDEDLAIAYNDRAVLHYLSGRLELAAADARRAASVSRLDGIAGTSAAIQAAVNRVARAND
jgi:hypothetical protein